MTAPQLAAPVPRVERSMFREILAVLLMTVGSIIPVLPWLVGQALLWSSGRWRLGEKLLGTLVWPFGYLSVLLLGLLPGQSCGSASIVDDSGRVTGSTTVCDGFALPPTLGITALTAVLVAPLVVGAFLLVRANRRAGSPEGVHGG